jgi:hypothetical protein
MADCISAAKAYADYPSNENSGSLATCIASMGASTAQPSVGVPINCPPPIVIGSPKTGNPRAIEIVDFLSRFKQNNGISDGAWLNVMYQSIPDSERPSVGIISLNGSFSSNVDQSGVSEDILKSFPNVESQLAMKDLIAKISKSPDASAIGMGN